MEMVLGSAVDINEMRKRICHIVLAVLLILSLAFTSEKFEDVMAVDAKDSWNVRAREDVLLDVAGNSLAIEDVLVAVNLAKTLNFPEEYPMIGAGTMTVEPAVMSVTAPAVTAPTVTAPEIIAPDVKVSTEDTMPDATNAPGTTVVPGVTDTPEAVVIPETLTIHLNGNGGEPAISTMTESIDAVSAEGWSTPFRPGKVFDGWYMDAGCTIPFTGVKPEDYILQSMEIMISLITLMQHRMACCRRIIPYGGDMRITICLISQKKNCKNFHPRITPLI